MGRLATKQDEVAVVEARNSGLSDRQIAVELGLTKGQVSGIYWRATSRKYDQQKGLSAEERLAGTLARFSQKHGQRATREIVDRVLGSQAAQPPAALRRFSWEVET